MITLNVLGSPVYVPAEGVIGLGIALCFLIGLIIAVLRPTEA